MELSLLILVDIHKSYIVYLEIYVVPIWHGFSFFFVVEKSWKINMEKEGAPCIRHAKLQSNHHHQQTNIRFFTGQMPFLSPNQ